MTKFKNSISDSISNNIGVPQGSVLGPILFIMYINDINDFVSGSKLNCFADDTSISCARKDINEAITILNSDLEKVSTWLKKNKLKLNISKTKHMIISNKKIVAENTVMIDGEIIERVSSFKYLGIVIDYQLKFKENSEYVAKKMAKKVNVLSRLNRKLSKESKITIYLTTIAPHIDYCSTLLYLINKEDIKRLQKIQSKAMRVILNAKRDVRIENLLNSLNWLSVNQRITFNCLVFIQKIQHGLLPKYLNNQIVYNRDVTPYNTRTRNDFRLPQCRKSQTQNSIYYKGLKQYNELPNGIKQETDLNHFKELLVQHILKTIKVIK